MDSWTARKRPWEDDSPIDLQLKRRGSSSTVSAARRPSPLPPRAGYYSRDNQFLSQRRLPPLSTQSCSTSAESSTTRPLHHGPPAQDAALADITRPRSQSLFNVFQHPQWPESQGYSGMTIFFNPSKISASSENTDCESS